MIEGYAALQARLRAIGDTRGMTKRLGLETVAEAKARVRRKTGTTARTIRITALTAETVTVSVGGAGAFLEHGTRPHLIRPRKARSLRFPRSGVAVTLGGRVRTGTVRRLGNAAYIFARLVHHPGTRPQPFLVPGAKAAIAKVGLGEIISNWNGAA